jgi:hypothetical protein
MAEAETKHYLANGSKEAPAAREASSGQAGRRPSWST